MPYVLCLFAGAIAGFFLAALMSVSHDNELEQEVLIERMKRQELESELVLLRRKLLKKAVEYGQTKSK